MLRIAVLLVFGLGAAAFVAAPPATPFPPLHPHFPKKIEVQLPGDITLAVSHITVTFDRDGEAKLPAGGSWHLGNAHLDVSKAVRIGGRDVPAGRHSLKGRKRDDGAWELLLDEPARFRSKVGDAALVLQTVYQADAPLREHLSIDIQPSGDKQSTSVFLEVHFDTRLARCVVELPGPAAGKDGGR